ncbi:MAG: MerR family DNA-binding protein [Acidobacteriota bacterium]
MSGLTIGQLAERAGVGIETIRFYERRGLVPEPPRRRSGYRQYPEEAVDRLRFVRRAKGLGFSLDEIGELLELRSHPRANRRRVHAKVEAKLADVERRIADLERLRATLRGLASDCANGKTSEPCPILEALEGMEESR